jgi:hypothetical protein
MFRRYLFTSLFAFSAALGLLAAAAPVHALEVWSGRTWFFVKADGADWTQAVNQDRIRPGVWITRKNSMGIYNIALESGYSGSSPAGTEWATGDAVNHASLTFQPWVQWAANNPPATVGVDAVVHLIAADLYIDIRFVSWSGGTTAGGFSYLRGVEPPVPAERGTWGRIKALYR